MTSANHGTEGHEDGPADIKDMRRVLTPAESELLTALPSPRQDLAFVQLKSLYLGKGLCVNEPGFSNDLDLFTADGRYNRLAYVLADNNELPVRISVYRGTDNSALMADRNYGGKCLLLAMPQAAEYAEALNETYVDMSQSVRADIPLFNAEIFRAAWHNACLHSSWYRLVPPQIDIYDDRMEIVSAGGLQVGETKDEFCAGASRPVNPELEKIMLQLGFTGPGEHGVQRIITAYGKDAVRISDNSITAVIPFRFNRSGNYTGGPSSDKTRQILLRRKILEEIQSDPHITTAQLAAACKYGTATISNYLAQMTKDSLIAREGSRKTGIWKVL